MTAIRCTICEKPAPNAAAREGLDAVCRSCMNPIGLRETILTTEREQINIARYRIIVGIRNRNNASNLDAKIAFEYGIQWSERTLAAYEVKAAGESKLSPNDISYQDWLLGKGDLCRNGRSPACREYTAQDVDRAGVNGW